MSQQDRKFSLSNYPLCWPDGWKRTPSHEKKQAHFKRYGNRASVIVFGWARCSQDDSCPRNFQLTTGVQ
jgi:hypothetical protein